jgi:hypothetical protein
MTTRINPAHDVLAGTFGFVSEEWWSSTPLRLRWQWRRFALFPSPANGQVEVQRGRDSFPDRPAIAGLVERNQERREAW